MGDEPEVKPTVGDWGCGLFAVIALAMAGLTVVGAVVELVANGPSPRLLAGTAWVLVWYWFGMGAWRRTAWSSTPDDQTAGPGC